MTTDTVNLPPLPEYFYGRECSPHEKVFTADQLRAYGLLAAQKERERCATICDNIQDGVSDDNGWAVAGRCASAIRGQHE